ncbi:MAG: hypothetical protein NTX79_07325 [Candidatus Micrarchaeota archaeon]|nr:hypothetical protein [Candidatus Micrarchaeota archaeon]
MNIQKIKRFGEQEIKLLFALEQEKSSIFTTAQARHILGTSDASVKNVIKRLKGKRRIITLQKGVYLFAPLKSGQEGLWTENAFSIVPSLVGNDDYYIGFAAAMNYWGMTEQLPRTVMVAMARQKKPLDAVQSKFIFVAKRRLGDHARISFAGTNVNISSVEQTILDALAFPEYCFGIEGAAKAIWNSRHDVDWRKLSALAKGGKSVVRRRLGFLLELLGLEKRAKEIEGNFAGFSWLAPNAQKVEFQYSKRWGLKVNLKKEDVLEFQRGY